MRPSIASSASMPRKPIRSGCSLTSISGSAVSDNCRRSVQRLGLRTKLRTMLDGRRSGGTAFSRGHLYLILSNPIYIVKPRTECGCQPVLAMMSSMVAPDCRRSIWITRSCLLCEGAPRRLGLGEAFRAFPCLPSYAGGRLKASGLFSVIDAKCEKAAGGDEQAKGAVVFVAAPFRCAIYGPSPRPAFACTRSRRLC
jgi:hypothetical protein